MLNPFTWAPVTDHLGDMSGDGGAGQMSMTLPLTEPPADPLCSKMLPLDHTSPTTVVVELPWNVSELPPLGQPYGASVCMAAPFVPGRRATAVAVAPTFIAFAPRTCITATGIWCVAVTAKVTPA